MATEQEPPRFATRDFGIMVSTRKSEKMEECLGELVEVEKQTAALVKLFFSRLNYLTIDQLEEELMRQELPSVDLRLVLAFLAGYLSSKMHDTNFERLAFEKESFSIGNSEELYAGSAALALINLMDVRELFTLPDRCSTSPNSDRKDED